MNRVLIAEDETRIASFPDKGLRAAGYTTTVVASGVDAATRARADDFDLMILDLGLPGQDGLAVLAQLRERGEQRPVIVLTARDAVPDRVAGLDLVRRTVSVDGLPVELTAREFLLAETFARHPGQVLSREQLPDRVWGIGHDPGADVVDVYIGYLRRKLGADVIQTVRGTGYRMVA